MRVSPSLLALGALLSGCQSVRSFDGVDVVTGRGLHLAPGSMPAEHSFSGDYLSPQTGKTTLLQTGGQLHGSYANRSCGCEIRGRVAGTVEGNLAELEWTETISGCTAARARHGEAFLFYTAPPDEQGSPKLFGERVYVVNERVTRLGETFVSQREPSAWIATRIFEAPLAGEAHCP
jgi:hypothetical protein